MRCQSLAAHPHTVHALQGTMDRKNIEKLATEDLLLKFLENKWACADHCALLMWCCQARLACVMLHSLAPASADGRSSPEQ